MAWRYQPVIFGEGENAHVSLVEVYLRDDDTLDGWTDGVSVSGDDIEDMAGDLAHMWIDAMCWKPVHYAELSPGLAFERTVDQTTRNELAEFLERGGSFLLPA